MSLMVSEASAPLGEGRRAATEGEKVLLVIVSDSVAVLVWVDKG